MHFVVLIFLITDLISFTLSQSDVLRVHRAKSLNPAVRRAAKGMENPFEMPEDASDDETAEIASPQICPVYDLESRMFNSWDSISNRALSDSFDLIRAINNFRIARSLPAINVSRSLMSTSCAHMRDISNSEGSINNDCGLHSWSSCCYPSDHSNPNCMHRKALQVTTALKWNIYNVAAYELAYEWAGGPFSAIRALDMFVANPDHKKFMLQEDSWSDFKWRSIGAAVGDRYAYIWFGTLMDPNGDFDQFNVESHIMELPGCTCTGTPNTWRPAPTLSPEQQAQLELAKTIGTVPSLYDAAEGDDDLLMKQLIDNSNATKTEKSDPDDIVLPTYSTSILNNYSTISSSGNVSGSQPNIPSNSRIMARESSNETNRNSSTNLADNLPMSQSLQNGANSINNSTSNPAHSGTVLDPKPPENVKQVTISLNDFLKSLTQG